jgi:uncharacterized protein YfiM (DUF2279 family)
VFAVTTEHPLAPYDVQIILFSAVLFGKMRGIWYALAGCWIGRPKSMGWHWKDWLHSTCEHDAATPVVE